MEKSPGLASRSLAKLRVPRQDRRSGEMAEWLKAHAWKACVRETVPWVRIPLSPPALLCRHLRRVYNALAPGSIGPTTPTNHPRQHLRNDYVYRITRPLAETRRLHRAF